MQSLLKKINFKSNSEILVLNIPDELVTIFDEMSKETNWVVEINQAVHIENALIFVLQQKMVEHIVPRIINKLQGDCILWFCYPKKSSKKYESDIDRDHGWRILGEYGFEPVRQVSINEDFSALRFRKVEFIQKITRRKDMALTEEAKKRTTN